MLALAAMLLRALIPVGWMPSSQIAQGTPIVICTQYGQAHVLVDSEGRRPPAPSDHENSGRTHPPCAFASIATLALPVIALAALPVLVEVETGPHLAGRSAPQVPPPAPWQSRAPPRPLSDA
jgi:hypothetical protein